MPRNGVHVCADALQASSLAPRIFSSQSKFAEENIDKLLDTHRAFVTSHFMIDKQSPLGNGIGYAINGIMRDQTTDLQQAFCEAEVVGGRLSEVGIRVPVISWTDRQTAGRQMPRDCHRRRKPPSTIA
jgi:hypothetical protein